MRINHIAMTVKNSEKSADFYKKNFGFNEVKRFTKPGWDGYAIILQLNDVQLEIIQFQNPIDKKEDLPNPNFIGLKHIGLQVDNVNDTFKDLKKKGVDIDKPIKGTTCAWICFLRDPDGINIELYQSN